jgi:aspartyl-tRNA(Asn)/glutamyl-tRNA(Gln) amidotransferase subunit A
VTNLIELTLAEIAHGLCDGSFTSKELTQAFLEQIDRLEPELHAFITLTPERALKQADFADKERAKQRKQDVHKGSPFLGIPIVIKDILVTKDIPTTAGSRILEAFVPPYNATAVKRLLDNGMVILGKTNMDEFAMGSSTENSAYKLSLNPWDKARVPGGSSGGSAAAVAARMAPIALGTDTGGSVRQPASFCGITGLKPSYGRVSRYGLIAFGSSLDSVGILGKSVADTIDIFNIIAGFDPLDATCVNIPLPKKLTGDISLEGMRIGIPKEYFIDGIQPEVDSAIRCAIDQLNNLGAEVLEISLPHTPFAIPVYYLIAPAEASANLARFDGVQYGPRKDSPTIAEMFRKTRGDFFGDEVKRRIMLGTYALSAGYYDAYYGKAQKVRSLIQQDFKLAFRNVDVIAAPVTPTTAFKIGAHSESPLEMYLEDIYTTPANLAGVPGLSIPVGFDDNDLPIGMQVLADRFREDRIFQVGLAYQRISDWHQRQPPMVANPN